MPWQIPAAASVALAHCNLSLSASFRFFHRPADGSEVMYDPVSVMNADILNYCQKESWCKLGFYLLSFFYYLYRWV